MVRPRCSTYQLATSEGSSTWKATCSIFTGGGSLRLRGG
jgi:hypothetical protein